MTKPRVLSKYITVDVSSARLNRIWTSVAVKMPVRTRVRGWLSAGAAAAALACVVLVTWRLTLHSQSKFLSQQAVVETASGATNVELADGSRLDVAARSRIEWAARDPHSTVVKLIRGSIACDVVPHRNRQFSVVAAGVRVQVTGTRFSVSYNPESGQVDVAVQRGGVSITTPNSSAPDRHLAAGESWSMEKSASTPAGTPAPGTSADSSGAASFGSAELAAPVNSSRAPAGTGQLDVPAPVVQDLPSARTLMDQGNAARRAGDTHGAANSYQSLLAKFPRDPRAGLAAFELGRLRMGPLGDISGAVRAFQSAIALSPGSAIKEDSMAHLVEAYAASGKGRECAAARDAYLKGYPNGVHAGVVRRQCGGT